LVYDIFNKDKDASFFSNITRRILSQKLFRNRN